MKELALIMIKLYQNFLSPDSGIPHKLFPNLNVCIFSPTCSEYTYQSIEKYGIIRGVCMGIRRIIKCGPWSDGGFDPVL